MRSSRFSLGGISMQMNLTSSPLDPFGSRIYTDGLRLRERVLNAAIVQADISESFEEYL